MSLLKKVLALLALSAVISGCASTPSAPSSRLNAFHETRPYSILVVPPNNTATDVQATTFVLATLPYFLAEKGFYVFPVNTVKTLLEYEGYYEPAEVHAAPTETLAELFKADAVLYVTIHEWTSKYLVINTVTEVDFEYKLLAADGSLVWKERLMMQHSPNNNSNNLAGLLVNAVSSAVERAKPNYLPITKSLHVQAFGSSRGIPNGPYHPSYNDYYERVDLLLE